MAIALHQLARRYEANSVGIPNGIPKEKQNRYIHLKSIIYMTYSDYPGPPILPDKARQARALSHLGITLARSR
jgi:hypothetical protein